MENGVTSVVLCGQTIFCGAEALAEVRLQQVL